MIIDRNFKFTYTSGGTKYGAVPLKGGTVTTDAIDLRDLGSNCVQDFNEDRGGRMSVAGDAIGGELTFHAITDGNVSATGGSSGAAGATVYLQTSPDGSSWVNYLTGRPIAFAGGTIGTSAGIMEVPGLNTEGADLFCAKVPQGLGRYVRFAIVGGDKLSGTGTITIFANNDL